VDLLETDVAELHNQATEKDLRMRAAVKAHKSVPKLLQELAMDRGLAWADIARLVGVSVSAVRKWRTGGDSSPEKRRLLAQLAAFLDLLSESNVEDPAQWLEMDLALPDGYSVRPLELYSDGHIIALLEVAGVRRTAEDVLDEVDPDWRSTRRSDFEVFMADDGDLALRERKSEL
jgi:transcriptional regulator with XRE-family HTH domain